MSELSLPSSPEMSVVVAVVDGEAALRRCLDRLLAQENPPAMEIIVPYDETIAEIGGLVADYATVRFLDLGRLGEKNGPLSEHDLLDLRRAAGLRAATGDLIGMVEDRGWPAPDWARAMVELHRELPHPAIGGAVREAAPSPWLRAVFACDYARSEPPFAPGPREYLTDINICYKRRALDGVRDVWRERYQEAPVNWALRRNGEALFLSPAPVVVMQRAMRTPAQLMRERFDWGRGFARIRCANASRKQVLAWTALSPALPAALMRRQLRLHRAKGRRAGAFFAGAPRLFPLLLSWSLGEFCGYVESMGRAHD